MRTIKAYLFHGNRWHAWGVAAAIWLAGFLISAAVWPDSLWYIAIPLYCIALAATVCGCIREDNQRRHTAEVEAFRALASEMKSVLDDIRETTAHRPETDEERNWRIYLERMIPLAEAGDLDSARALRSSLDEGHSFTLH